MGGLVADILFAAGMWWIVNRYFPNQLATSKNGRDLEWFVHGIVYMERCFYVMLIACVLDIAYIVTHHLLFNIAALVCSVGSLGGIWVGIRTDWEPFVKWK